MSTIDERIVKLSFDNKGFESGVAKTLASLEKLNQALEKTDNRQAAKELTKSMNDINKVLKNNNLGNLDKMLNKQGVFSKITDGVSKLGSGILNAFKKIDFTGIGSKLASMLKDSHDGASALAKGVDTVAARFSNLQVIAMSALSNITNRMVDAGIAMGKALTIDPIKDGFAEYETKMNAMQTIFANTSHKGTTYDDITKALEELNKYSDKTIYNFGQMTDNIGKFTAAGVDLDTSVSAIKGLANLAAMSGVDNARAQGVMYQASQALSKGFFALQDWRSFSNNGMGNDRFKQLLIETGDLLGTGASAAIEAAGSFDESLTKSKWLTNDVMNEALKMLAGYYDEADLLQMGFNKKQAANIMQLAKQAEESATQIRTVTQLFDTMKEAVGSGWAKTWEWIIGDKEQATELLTGISKGFEALIQPGIDARNKMFEEWNKGGGRDSLISGFKNMFEGVGKVAGSVKDAFRDIFPAMTGKKLIELTKGFENFTEKLKISDKTAAKIKDTFKGVFSIFDIGKTAIGSIFKAFSGGGGLFSGLGNGLLTVTSTIGKFFSSINDGIKSSGIFDKISSSISNVIKSIGDGFNKAGEFIGNIFKSMGKINFKPIMDFVGQLGSGFGKGIGNFFSGIGEAVKNIDVNKVLGFITAISGLKLFKKISKPFDSLAKSFKSFSDIGEAIGDALNSITAPLKAMSLDINANALLKIAAAVGILSLALAGLSTINTEGMANAIMGITAMMGVLVGAMAMLTKIGSGGSKGGFIGNIIGSLFGGGGTAGAASGLILLASALLILSGAVKMLSSLNPQEMITGLVGIAGSMLVLVGAAKMLNGVKVPLMQAGASMILVAAAMNVMASAVKKFGEINPNNMLVGLMGIATTLVELAAFMKLADFGGLNISSAVGLIGVAAALLVLQNAVSKFGSMDLKGMAQGLLGVGGALAIIAGFSRLASTATSMLVMAGALVVMGGALHILSSAVRSMAGMQWTEMARGLTAMAGSLAILAAAVRLMSGLGLLSLGAGLVVASAGLLLLGNAVKSLAELSWEDMARGLTAMAGGLLVLGVAAGAMSGMIVGAGALLVLAGAMAILTPQLVAMSNLSWGQVAIGLTTLAGAMAILGVAGLAATAIAPGLIVLGGAVALLGVGCLAAGAGISLFAAGLGTLAAVGAGGLFVFTEAIRNLINLLPQVGTKLGEFVTNLATAFAQGIPQIANAIGQAMVGLLESLRTYGPQMVAVGTELIVLLCNALIQAAPQLINTAVQLIVTFVNALAGAAGQLATAGANLIVNLLNGLSSKVGEIIQAAINLAIALIDGLSQGIQNNAERVGTALGNLIKVAVDSAGTIAKAALKELGSSGMVQLASGITSGAGKAVTAMGQAVSKAVQSAKSKATQFLSAGKQWVSSLASGVRGAVGTVTGAIGSLVSSAVSKARSAASQFLSAAKQWVSQLASGIRSGAGQAASAVRSCVSSAVSAARGAAGQFVSAGRSMITGLISGIRSAAGAVASAARSVVQGAINAAKSALKINSPSKVFIEIGKYTSEGMAIGIDKNARMVETASRNMATSAINNVKNSVRKIADAIDMNTDVVPTITPVLDLSNVEQGSRTIGQLLSSNNSLPINANVTGVMSRSIGRIQNGNNNSDVANALKDLKNTMANNPGNTYQINGITYDNGSAISAAVETLVRAAMIERRI